MFLWRTLKLGDMLAFLMMVSRKLGPIATMDRSKSLDPKVGSTAETEQLNIDHL